MDKIRIKVIRISEVSSTHGVPKSGPDLDFFKYGGTSSHMRSSLTVKLSPFIMTGYPATLSTTKKLHS